MKKPLPPAVTAVEGNVIARFDGKSAGDTLRLLFLSDIHFDSIYCEREILKRHLETNHDAWIVIAGDLFDAMQGKYDRRRSYDEIRPEYIGEDYYDRIVRDAAAWWMPYASRILYVGYGNHETSVIKNTGTDLLQRWVALLRRETSTSATVGAFASWLRVVLGRDGSKSSSWGGGVNIRIAHSAGGGNAKVTRGVIDTNRQAVYLSNADIVLNGDNHEGYVVPIAREEFLPGGRSVHSVVWFLRTPGYKRAFGRQRYGFDTEKISAPKPVGCILTTIRAKSAKTDTRTVEILPQPMIE